MFVAPSAATQRKTYQRCEGSSFAKKMICFTNATTVVKD